MQKVTPKNQIHIPVLLNQTLEYLDPKPGEMYLDLTAGYGGHAEKVLERTLNAKSVLVDRDINAVDYLMSKFKGGHVTIRHSDFYGASVELQKSGETFDLILADLGVSSPHLNNASRGFSISQDGPLDMRMDEAQTLSADEIVNSYSEEELSDILKRYGEEPKARQIARLIVRSRPLHTTFALAQVVSRAWPGRSKVHPATRTFQALRMAVNDEIKQIESSLPIWIDLLKPGGRLVIISFHSLEDRLVKDIFREEGAETYDAKLKILTKRPVTADDDEKVFNPRARSAKLRAAVKIKTQKGG